MTKFILRRGSLPGTNTSLKVAQRPGSTVRARIHHILGPSDAGDKANRIVNVLLVVLISSSVLSVILESIPALESAYRHVFYWIELVTIGIFSVEYILRVWSSVEAHEHTISTVRSLGIRLRYMLSPSAIIDFVAILPFYLFAVGLFGNVDMRFLRSLRMLRILKLTRYSSAFDILISTCRENTRSLMAAFFVLVTVMLIAASGMYYFERHAQPVAFASIPDAMWWAVSTLTTVGYGDITPITAGGKLFGAVITVIGVGMVALPTGILASGYSAQTRLREQQFRFEAKHALEDGVISQQESSQLDGLRLDLSMSEQTASQILDEELVQNALVRNTGSGVCPYCGASNPGG